MQKSKPAAQPEQVAFRMHPHLLHDVVCRQAGTLPKAILEAVMNAVDARATECDVTLTNDTLVIVDNGEGITSKEAILERFATFGQPHDPSERKAYGTFRMGRGQLMSFGENVWTTGSFRMKIDFKNCPRDATGFELLTDQEPVVGCRIAINLYEELRPSVLLEYLRIVAQWCRYAQLKLTLNDEVISVDPATEEWTHILPGAYIRLTRAGSLTVFNLGVHCTDIPSYRYGCGGVVVSREQLKVNFARNEVQSDCPVWRKVMPLVNAFATEHNLAAPNLDDSSRQRLTDQLLSGDLGESQVARLKLLTPVHGRSASLRDLLYGGAYSYRVSVAPRGDARGVHLHRSRVAYILAPETLTRFGVKTGPAFIAQLQKVRCLQPMYGQHLAKLHYAAFETLTEGLSDQHDLLAESDLKPNEVVWLKILSANLGRLRLALPDLEAVQPARLRRISIGVSEADGWTDGSSYLAVSRKFLATQELNAAGYVNAGLLLMHELCTSEADSGEHTHDVEFYELEESSLELSLGSFVAGCLSVAPKVLLQTGRRLTKRQQAAAAKEADAVHAQAKLSQHTS